MTRPPALTAAGLLPSRLAGLPADLPHADIAWDGARVLSVWLVTSLPPTINHAYRRGTADRRGGDTYRTDALIAYEREVWAAIRAAGWSMPPLLWPAIAVRLEFYMPNRRRQDIDNRIKPTLDALSRALAFDDARITDLIVRKYLSRDHPRCEACLWEGRPFAPSPGRDPTTDDGKDVT